MRANRLRMGVGMLALPLLLLSGLRDATAVVVDFAEYRAGRIIDTEYATGGADNTSGTLPTNKGFMVSVTNDGGGPDIAVLYDTEYVGGDDPDLEGGSSGNRWTAGNLDGTPAGNALVIQESATSSEIDNGKLNFSTGKSSQGRGNAPDDESGGGSIVFSFESELVSFGFDWVDLDNSEGVTISFIDSFTGMSASIVFSEFLNVNSDFYRSGVVFGDHTANRISEISVGDISSSGQVAWSGGSGEPESFDQVRFDLTGSGGISSISFTPVPEPGTVLGGALLLGFVVVGGYRRLRRREVCRM